MVAHYLYSVCTYHYAESGLISIMRFIEIWTVFVLRLSFAVSKTDEILSLGAGDHTATLTIVRQFPSSSYFGIWRTFFADFLRGDTTLNAFH